MKIETILKSVMIAALFAGVAGTEVNAAKVKEGNCKDLIIDLSKFDYDVDLDYRHCDEDENKHFTVPKGKVTALRAQEGKDSNFGMEQCFGSNCPDGGKTQHIFPGSTSKSMENIGNGWTITCTESGRPCDGEAHGTVNKK